MVEKDAVSKDLRKQVLGYGLTTAEIVYRRPDRHWLPQSYIWQDYDMFPNFRALKDFLAFWETTLDGPCSQSLSHIRNSSSLQNCTPSMASSACIDRIVRDCIAGRFEPEALRLNHPALDYTKQGSRLGALTCWPSVFVCWSQTIRSIAVPERCPQ